MKRICLILAVLLFAPFAWGQGQRYQNQLTTAGFPNPTVRVCTEPATGTPCTPLASIYSDSGLSQPLSNPFTGDSSGNYAFYAACGVEYHIQISGSGLTTLDIPNQALAGCGGTAANPAGSTTQVQFNLSGAFAASANFTWNNSTQVLTLGQSASTAGQLALGNATGLLTLQAGSGTGTLTLPAATDTLVGRATTDTLSNKTLSGDLFSGLTSATVSPAVGGALNFATGDTILIENAAGNAALNFLKDLGAAAGNLPADVFQMTGGGVQVPALISSASSPAASGFLRLGNGDLVTGRNAANAGDVQLLTVNGSNQTVVGDSNGVLLNGTVAAYTQGGQITFSGLGAGTAPFAGLPSGSAQVTNLNANFLEGHDWGSPGAIGGTVPSSAVFTTIQATSATFTGGGNLNTQTTAALVINLTNDAGNAASWNNTLACINSAGHAIPCANGATSGILGVCVINGSGTCSNSGTAEIARAGNALCTFNASGVTVGHYVISDAASNKCADGGATVPSQQYVGVAAATGGAGATVDVLVTTGNAGGGGSGFANPMTTQYDLIVGGVGGAAARLAGNTANSSLCLVSTGNGTSTTSTAWGACSGTSATALSALTAALGANTLASGNNDQVWQWSLSTASTSAFTLTESAASTAATSSLLNVHTLASSTLYPLTVTAGGTANGVQMSTAGLLGAIGTGGINATQLLGSTWAIPGAIGSTTPNSGAFTTLTSSSPIGVSSGGTGQSTLQAHGTMVGEGTSGVAVVSPGTSGQCYMSNGGSADPSFQGCPGSTVSEVYNHSYTGQTAVIGTTTAYAVPSNGAGMYCFSWNLHTTTFQGTSATLQGNFYHTVDGTSFTEPTNFSISLTSTSSEYAGQQCLWADASTNLQYSTSMHTGSISGAQYSFYVWLVKQ